MNLCHRLVHGKGSLIAQFQIISCQFSHALDVLLVYHIQRFNTVQYVKPSAYTAGETFFVGCYAQLG